jgi:hypothetical protein
MTLHQGPLQSCLVQIAQLKSTVAASKQEIKLRDKRILELENEIREIEKELPKVRRPRGPPEKWKTGIFDCFADTEICESAILSKECRCLPAPADCQTKRGSDHVAAKGV